MDVKREPNENDLGADRKVPPCPTWFDVPIENSDSRVGHIYIKRENTEGADCAFENGAIESVNIKWETNLQPDNCPGDLREEAPLSESSITCGEYIAGCSYSQCKTINQAQLKNVTPPSNDHAMQPAYKINDARHVSNKPKIKQEIVTNAFDVDNVTDKRDARVALERTFFFERNFICNICFECLPTANLLKEHKLYMHVVLSCTIIEQQNGIKVFSCEECNYTSSKVSHLRAHKVIHTGEKPFKCDKCEYTCTFASNLQSHKKGVHIGKKPFKCNVCQYRCERSHDLQRHETIHNIGFTVKRFMCRSCNYKCNFPSSLKKHELIHTGEKSFECDQCDYRCRNPGDLKKHNMVHSGEKPFACDTCNFKCAQSSSMKRHKMMHTGEKPYKCSLCDCKYTQLVHLRRHDRLVHSS